MNRFRISLISILLGTALAFQVVIPASAVEVEQAPYTAADYLSAKFAAKTRNHRILIGN